MPVTTAIDSGPKLRGPEKRVVQPKQRMQLVIVRHGETDWTLTGRYTATDVDLTANGRHEAASLEGLKMAYPTTTAQRHKELEGFRSKLWSARARWWSRDVHR